MKLSAAFIKSAQPRDKMYKLSDGANLYLVVFPNGSKRWNYRYRYNGKSSTLSFGVYPDVSLKEAREKRDEVIKQLQENKNPYIERQKQRLAAYQSEASTFSKSSREWWEMWSYSKPVKNTSKVWRLFEADILPYIGSYPIKEIEVSHIKYVLEKIVQRGAISIARLAGQSMNQVFNRAVDLREITINPISTKTLGHIIPAQKVQNQKRVSRAEIPQLLRDIDSIASNDIIKYAIQLVSLTFVRAEEMRNAEWSEFDLQRQVWIIPATRMKRKVQHIVPLSKQVIAILEKLKALTGSNTYLFPSQYSGVKLIGLNTMIETLYRKGYQGRMTIHGFRGIASTELRENGFKRDIVELQLSHIVGSEVERAYNSMELLPERTDMMQWWADYLDRLRIEGVRLRVVL